MESEHHPSIPADLWRGVLQWQDPAMSISSNSSINVTSSQHHAFRRGHRHGRHGNATVIATACTSTYAHWLRHLHTNLLFFGLHRMLRVCAADNATVAMAASMHIPAVKTGMLATWSAQSSMLVEMALRGGTSDGFGSTFSTAGWNRAVHFKQQCFFTLLERVAPGAAVLLVDTDVTFFSNPLPLLVRLNGLDMAVLDDSTPRDDRRTFNSGFLALWNTPATRAFGRAFLAQLSQRQKHNDQSVFNDVLNGCLKPDCDPATFYSRACNTAHSACYAGGFDGKAKREKEEARSLFPWLFSAKPLRAPGTLVVPGTSVRQRLNGTIILPGTVELRVRALEQREFMCGYFFYEFRGKRRINTSAIVAVHHNWIRGDRNKWDRAVAYSAVVTDANETLAHFLRRARSSMMRMPAWEYRNPRHAGNKLAPSR
jgi:hypothetical protein